MNMFVQSAVWKHPHELSPPSDPRRNSLPARRSPLTRSAFSTPIPRVSSTYERRPPIIQKAGRPVSEVILRGHERTEHTVRFQEPESDRMSEDERSVVNSETSETTAGGSRRRRRSAKTGTTYTIAHPAPTVSKKHQIIQIRPKLLLQLQHLSTGGRPRPAMDVLSSTAVVPKLAKRFPRLFRGHAQLGANDVMVVKSEDYDAETIDGSESDEEGFSNRELMGVICQMRKDAGGAYGKAEIVLGDGSVWTATPLPNNTYEFVSLDSAGNATTARWVKRPCQRKSVDLAVPLTTDFRYVFSILDPNTRRHPILATLTPTILDIPDHYTSVSSSAGKYPPTSSMRSPQGESDSQSGDEELTPERTSLPISEDMKTLAQLTGIWVALRKGVSPYFTYNDPLACGAPSTNARASLNGRLRSASLVPDDDRPNYAGSPSSTPDSSLGGAVGNIGGKIKRSCPGKALPANDQSLVPKRAASAGSAFMQRVAARRVSNTPSTIASDSNGESPTPPKRAATESFSNKNGTSSEAFDTTPRSLHLPGSSTTTPDTPTKSQRRAKSTQILPSALSNMNIEVPAPHSFDLARGDAPWKHGESRRASRWQSFKNLFHRRHKH